MWKGSQFHMGNGEVEWDIHIREVVFQDYGDWSRTWFNECHWSFFPFSFNLLCTFHIVKNVGENACCLLKRIYKFGDKFVEWDNLFKVVGWVWETLTTFWASMF